VLEQPVHEVRGQLVHVLMTDRLLQEIGHPEDGLTVQTAEDQRNGLRVLREDHHWKVACLLQDDRRFETSRKIVQLKQYRDTGSHIGKINRYKL
jgi:hypothetical protein